MNCGVCFFFFFFFSSRRRHTRSLCDWSSDVCSSDLSPEPFSNWVLSLGEDALAVWLSWMATAHPVATTAIVAALLVLCVFLLYRLFRFARRALQRLLAA